MAQTIHTKKRGDHTFRKTWASSDGRHIGALAGGGYAYLSGLLVMKREDLTDLIPTGPEREKALAWWNNKDQDLEEKQTNRIILDADNEFKWEDGSPIISAQSLIENLPRGKKLDMMLAWFHEREQTKNDKAKNERLDIDRATQTGQEAIKEKMMAQKRSPGRPRKNA